MDIDEALERGTPGPWRQNGRRIEGSDTRHTNGRRRNRLGISSASYSDEVCTVYGDLSLEAPKANAALLVHGYNLLQARIVDVLREYWKWHAGDKWRNSPDEEERHAWKKQRDRIEAMLAKAEEVEGLE